MDRNETPLQAALRRLGENPDFRLILDDIIDHRDDDIAALRQCHTPEDVMACSGRITALDELHAEWVALSSTEQG